MSETNQNGTQTLYIPMGTKQLVKVALFGILAGLFVWGLTFVFEAYILKAVFCPGSLELTCAPSAQYGEAIGTIIGAAVSLFVLVKLQVFRPLLVVIATVISLWGLIGIIDGLPLYLIALSVGGLYMFTYLVFTWITRLRLFIVVVILLLALIVAIRLILTA